MKGLLTDPVVLASGGVLLFAIILWFWALAGLRRAKAPAPSPDLDIPFATQMREDIPEVPAAFPAYRAPDPAPAPPPMVAPISPPQVVVPEINRQVAEKVDLIALRLVDMQMVLNKQLMAPATGGASGLTPENIDKLVNMMTSVIGQVEILQKTMTQAKGEGVVKAPEA